MNPLSAPVVLFNFMAFGVSMSAALAPIQQVISDLQDSSITRYNNDLTKDIFVKQIHSHNDYWRDIPLYTALSYGVQSVEADVWYFEGDEQLYVGHHESCLNFNRTFKSLYIDPLVRILEQANPQYHSLAASENRSISSSFSDTGSYNGVFDTDTSATLYLFVDVKTEGETTWPIVETALDPLREEGYLTYFNSTDIVKGPITVIGTGNTPYDLVKSQKTRDYFFDGPLSNLTHDYPRTLSPIASSSLKALVGADMEDIPSTGLNETQIESLNSFVENAHSKGIKTRVWGVPWWPVSKKINLTKQILESGSDFMNADDLEWASGFY